MFWTEAIAAPAVTGPKQEEGGQPLPTRFRPRDIAKALADARPLPVWWEDQEPGPDTDRLSGDINADLVIVGGELTGLWAAIEAVTRQPGRSVVLLEGSHVAAGASGRNGGFVSPSLTLGLSHGAATWPDELPQLLQMGHRNLVGIEELLARENVDAQLRLCGKTTVATRPHEVAALHELHALHRVHRLESTYLTAKQVRADVHSPTYLAGLSTPAGGLVHPVRMTTGLLDGATAAGALPSRSSALDSGADDATSTGPRGRARKARSAAPDHGPVRYRI